MLSVLKSAVPDSVKWKLRKWVWMRLNPSWQLKSGIVIRVLNYNDWMIYNDIFVDGEYDAAIQQLFTGNGGTARVLDLGANVGFFTLRVADTLLRRGIHDFESALIEGSPSTFAELKERLAANDALLANRLTVVNGLVGNRMGHATIVETPSHGENTILGTTRKGREVSFVDVEEIVRKWDRIDLLKCDIEGAEELFLANYPAVCRKARAAVFEFHHDSCDIPHCRQLLAEAGLPTQVVVREFGRCSVELFSRA